MLDKEGHLIPELTVSEAEKLQEQGIISGGMIPKIQTCVEAVRAGADGAVILDGRHQHQILLELFTEHGTGTLIRAD